MIHKVQLLKQIIKNEKLWIVFFHPQNYDALNTQLSSETAQLHAEHVDTEKEVKKLEQKWQDLKLEYDRAEMLLEKARQESEELPKDRKATDGKQATTLRETLALQLREQENVYAKLKNVSFFWTVIQVYQKFLAFLRNAIIYKQPKKIAANRLKCGRTWVNFLS